MSSERKQRRVETVILEMSQEGAGRIYGYELSRRARVRPAVMYGVLGRLLDGGALESHWEDAAERQSPPRRFYTLTDAGHGELSC